MTPTAKRILILGGTGEARRLAHALSMFPSLTIISSLAGRTLAPFHPAGELRIGGFGGTSGLFDYLGAELIDLVIDATHPYASAISRHAAEACAAAARPLIRLERPAWRAEAGDRWIEVDNPQAAAHLTPSLGRRAFLSIGVKELSAFTEVKEVFFLIRLIEPPDEALRLKSHAVHFGRGPFDERDERALLRNYEIDLVIAKNSGGHATYGKMLAARSLDLPVILLRRPVLPPVETVQSVDQAVAWALAAER